MAAVDRFLEAGSGYGSGYGCGYGCGSGYGSGDSYGCGYGSGYGSGYGCGYGSGDGCGYGSGIARFGSLAVYLIDGVQTVIYKVKGALARGAILRDDLTLQDCYIVKSGNLFAHGETVAAAREALQEKIFDDMDEDERIAAFWECHDRKKKYPARDLYEWHHKLTGSCELGRKTFAQDRGIDLDRDTFTVPQFVNICKDAYGGAIIARLLEDGHH